MPVAPIDSRLLWTMNLFRTADGRYVAAWHDAENQHMGIGAIADTMGEAFEYAYDDINRIEADVEGSGVSDARD